MSRSWTRSYDTLPPDATQVLRAMVLLELPTAVTDELAAILEREPAQVAAAIDTLRRTRWMLTAAAGAEVLVEDGRRWLTDTVAGTAEPAEIAELADRYAAYHAGGLDLARHGVDQVARWASDHRDGVVGVIRTAVRAGLPKVAVELATAAWEVADRVSDRSWLGELVQCGEDAAREARDRDAFFGLLDRSAAVFVGAGDRETGMRQWIRAQKLADDHGEHDRSVRIRNALGGLYCQWGRLSKAIDTYIALVDEHQRAGERIAAAGALTELGAVMLDARRPTDATVYLSRADELFTEAEPEPTLVPTHARALELWGRALWRAGKRGSARRRWERALAMLVDHDDTAANRVRALLANPDESLAD